MNSPTKVFVTFASGTQNHREAANRLTEQIAHARVFDTILQTDLPFLQNNLGADYHKHEDFIRHNPRGLGYWLWKPLLIHYLLRTLPEDALLFYADAGCEFFIEGKKNLIRHLRLASQRGSMFYRLPYPEGQWTKSDLFRHNNIRISNPFAISQVQATYFIIKNNKTNQLLVENWLNIANECSYHYLDDSTSFLAEDNRFIEHRHDQSILSCLIHSMGLRPTGYAFHYPQEFVVSSGFCRSDPIYSSRNISGTSVLLLSERALIWHNSVHIFILYLLLKLRFRMYVELVRFPFLSNVIKMLRGNT
jgi:hypothetical protein